MQILHLSHTDISADARILKEMNSLALSNDKFQLHGVGISSDIGMSKTQRLKNISLELLELKTKKWVMLPRKIRHLFSLIEFIFKLLFKSLKYRPKVIHCHDILVLPLGVLIKMFHGGQLIYDAHELESNKNGISRFTGKLIFLTEKILWPFVDGLIVVSDSIETWYKKELGVKVSEVILNSPVLGEETFSYNQNYLREKFSIPINEKVFLYIGVLTTGRGLDLILEVFKKDDISAHVVFLGYGSLKELLRDEDRSHSNIHLHDAVPHEEVVSVAKSADVGLCFIQNVSLSDYYCLPNKLFEYSFSEIPVLASNFPDITRVVKQYGLGECCNLDSQSIYDAVKYFEEMEQLPTIDKMTLIELGWHAQEKKLINIYQKIIENGDR